MSTPIEKLTALGQSLWLDNIQRRQLENGELKAMIERGDIRGMTSNPSIFNHAISKSTDYDFGARAAGMGRLGCRKNILGACH